MKKCKKDLFTLWSLAKNDFVTRFAGSYFGIIWAFVQPMVLILMYVFIFQVAFPADLVNGEYPYVLWLVPGITPWFFFSEGVVNATNCLLEYSYLVKKIVFPIKILPLVKILASLFVHLFFIGFTLLISVAMGYKPTLYFIQIIYYLLCLVLLVIALGFFTSSVMPFFKDFMPIVNICMQVGMWMTPILWDVDRINLGIWKNVLKANPVAYIVQGYRQSYLGIGWFWEQPLYALWFWGLVIFLMAVGILSFRKMTPHFADVL